MTAHCSHLTWTSALLTLKQIQRDIRHTHRSLHSGTVPAQVGPMLCTALSTLSNVALLLYIYTVHVVVYIHCTCCCIYTLYMLLYIYAVHVVVYIHTLYMLLYIYAVHVVVYIHTLYMLLYIYIHCTCCCIYTLYMLLYIYAVHVVVYIHCTCCCIYTLYMFTHSQLTAQLKERKTFFQRVVANMQGVLLDSDILTLCMQYFCQLAQWMSLQACGGQGE